MFIKLKSGMKQIGNKTRNQHFFSQFIICHSSLATGHLNSPFIHICYNTDSFCYWFIQYWMLEKKKRKRNHLKKRKVFKDTVNGMGKEEKLDKNKTKEYETSESYCQRILDGEESSSITNTLRYLIKIIKHSLPEF